MSEPRLALGLMSGTSLDGVDAALVETDGLGLIAPRQCITVPYEHDVRERLRAVLGGNGPVEDIARDMTLVHAEAVLRLLADSGTDPAAVAAIGFHGHTILHRPEQRRTWQIGDGALLAERTGIDVINDFRAADIEGGGQGAPLVPIFHAAMTREVRRQHGPVAVLNLGGVGNVTWIAGDFDPVTDPVTADRMIAFDTGPGNALIDDWVRRHTGQPHDEDGRLAAAGRIDDAALAALLARPFFELPPPKSLDRNDFDLGPVEQLSAEDGAATLTAFTAEAVAHARAHFPEGSRQPGEVRWFVSGGGRRNASLMKALGVALGDATVAPIEALGLDGDALEAQAFAYFAVRTLRGFPITFPSTTGVRRPTVGGVFHKAPARGRQAAGG
jgi:anhydro-N-acetylmuramic acid kinase